MKGIIKQDILPSHLIKMCEEVQQTGDRLQMAYARYLDSENAEVLYLASMGSKKPFQLFRCKIPQNTSLPSLANLSPLMGWYEREMSDLFGLNFLLHPEPFPLVLHEGANPVLPPLLPKYPPDALMPFQFAPWIFPKIENENLQQLPYGPVRAAVCESAQFIYFYAGEAILHFYERLFFKHRGMEKRFERLTPELGAILAERVSGVGSVAHALAFCEAVESACDCTISMYAKQWRVVLAELERLYNHLHYLGHLCHTTTLKVGEAEGCLLEEKIKQLNAKVTGSRFLREIITPGGLRREPDAAPISQVLKSLRKEVTRYCDALCDTNSHLDRLFGTGILTREAALDQGATGPVSRASNVKYDFRSDHPYAAYDQYAFAIPTRGEGDAYARMIVRMQEIQISFDIIELALINFEKGPLHIPCHAKPFAEGLGWAESPRGGLFYAVHFNQSGELARVKIKSPSFSNWRVFPLTVHDTNMMDYAINEASFGLTIAGCDR